MKGEVISADSRQVYTGLDIGSGKDLREYDVQGEKVPYHLIDLVGLGSEYSVFQFQKDFFRAFAKVSDLGRLPVLVGGTGLYLESVLNGYHMVEVPENPALRTKMSGLGMEALNRMLQELKPEQHNSTDTEDRARLERAIEIACYARDHEPVPTPEVNAFILGMRWPREILRERIMNRLKERMDAGLVEEVQGLYQTGIPWARLELLGLEYRSVSEYLQGKIHSKNDLTQKLHAAICKFAKRQETWFRRMERNGTTIHWIDKADADTALALVREQQWIAP
jgi:tRNA dimethylallyltransferase